MLEEVLAWLSEMILVKPLVKKLFDSFAIELLSFLFVVEEVFDLLGNGCLSSH